MILKESFVGLADRSSVKWAKTLHLYGGFFRRWTYPGQYIRTSIRELLFQRRFYKGFRQRLFKKGRMRRAYIVRSCYKLSSPSITLSFKSNKVNFIKKKKYYFIKTCYWSRIIFYS